MTGMKDNSEEAVLGWLPWTITPWWPTAAWLCPVHHLYQIPVWASSLGSHAGPLSLDFILICFPHFPPSVISKPLMVWETPPWLWPCSSDAAPNLPPTVLLWQSYLPSYRLHFSEGYQALCNPNQRSSSVTSIQLSVISCGWLQFLKSSTYSTVPFPSHHCLSSLPALFTHSIFTEHLICARETTKSYPPQNSQSSEE